MGIGSEKFERMTDGIVRMYGGEEGEALETSPMADRVSSGYFEDRCERGRR